MSNISSGGHLWQLDGGQLREEPGSLAGADVGDGGGDDGGDVDGDVNGDGAGDIDSDGNIVSDVGGTPTPQIPHFFGKKMVCKGVGLDGYPPKQTKLVK